jgi:hypothetical protein
MIWHVVKHRRCTVRQALGYIGFIQTEPDAALRYCVVMDESEGGVRLSIPDDLAVPSRFFLRYAGTEGAYKVLWQNDRVLGAELDGERRRRYGSRSRTSTNLASGHTG